MLDATVTSKGQITIPIDIRSLMGVQAGDKIRFVQRENGEITIRRKKKYTLEDISALLPKPKISLTDKQIKAAVGEAIAANYEEKERRINASFRKKKSRASRGKKA